MLRLLTLGTLQLRTAVSGSTPTDAGEPSSQQPKRLALLAYLAARHPPVAVPRDLLLALFWPDSETKAARRALRQALHHLRNQAGPDIVRSTGELVGTSPATLWCDAVALREAIAAGDPETAVRLYNGEFLSGFHAAETALELEEWIIGTRRTLATSAAEAAWQVAGSRECRGDLADAEAMACRAVAWAPEDEKGIRRLAELRARLGDRMGALRILERHAHRLRQDFGADPDPATSALASRLRLDKVSSASPSASSPPPALAANEAARAVPAVSGPWRMPRRRALAALLTAAAMGMVFWLGTSDRVVPAPPLVRNPEVNGASPGRSSYDAGLRAFYSGDMSGATRLFGLAIGQDSTLARAAMFSSLAHLALSQPDSVVAGLRKARHLASLAEGRDRRLVELQLAISTNSPSGVQLAESLATRYPGDPDIQLQLARALTQDGRFLAGSEVYRHLLRFPGEADRDSALCLSCDAINGLGGSLVLADSFSAALTAVREWNRANPESEVTLGLERNLLVALGRHGEAAILQRRLASTSPGASDLVTRAVMSLSAGAFSEAEAVLRVGASDGNAGVRREALWWQVIVLRNQGRLDAALGAARRYRQALAGSPEYDVLARVPEATVLLAMNRPAAAAAIYDAIGRIETPGDRLSSGSLARHRSWALVRAADARASAGDTVGLERLADSLEVLGRESGFGRDRRLHWHIRGLLALGRGRPAEAVPLFRAAIYSPVNGYTRSQLELGRILLGLGRHGEAVAVVAPALRGPHESSNLYVTHTELHELLADCYAAAGQQDSARVHYAWVARAWERSDPPLRQRAERAKSRLRVGG